MQITVSGKQIEVGEALRTHVENKLSAGINKYLDRVTDANVVISKRTSYLFTADIVVNTGTHEHMTLKSHAEGQDPYVCFDAAADKVEKQLRRYKRKLTDHHRSESARAKLASEDALHYVIDTSREEEVEDNPLVIAETTTPIETLSVGEAVMRLELQDLPALMFFNGAHGGLNVVYRRRDGNVAWVDPRLAPGKGLRKTA